MIPPSPLPHEDDRVADLLRHNILDTPEEKDFNDIVQLAALLCQAEIALVSLVDDRRQWFKAKVGLDIEETPKELSFCAHALHSDEILEIHDASQDERFHDNPAVTGDYHVRFYAGKPLFSAHGYPLGTLCVVDRYSRCLSREQRNALTALARQVERLLDLRLALYDLSQSVQVIEQQHQSLQQLSKIQNQTLGVLSHDLRSPLLSLAGVLDLFDQKALSGPQTLTFIPELRSRLKQTYCKVNTVLEWVKHQTKNPVTDLSALLLPEVLEQCRDWVLDLASAKHITITLDYDPATLAPALGQTDILVIVLRNLLSNAIKYSLQGQAVVLFARNEGDRVRVGVIDRGVGMESYALEALLSRNHGYSTPGTAEEPGTGLGIMLCQAYLANLNSCLEVNSEIDRGSTFSFCLPQG